MWHLDDGSLPTVRLNFRHGLARVAVPAQQNLPVIFAAAYRCLHLPAAAARRRDAMTPQERQLIDELFDRLSRLETAPRDADAETAIVQALRRAPNATYALVPMVLLQDEALKRANARLEELEGHATTQSQSGGFLDNRRAALFG